MTRIAALLTLCCLVGSALAADPYRLVPGDQISVSDATRGTSMLYTVDLDGQVRLPGAGGVPVSGATLDQTEEAIARRISEAGVLLNPTIAVHLQAHAPIIVSGDVSQPGQFDFVPGMRVGAAVALAGGGTLSGVSPFEIERARIDNEGFLRALNAELAGLVARVARFEALVADAPRYEISPTLRARVPFPATIPMPAMEDTERTQFDTARQLMAQSLAAWDEEVALIEAQLQVLKDRRALQDGLAQGIRAELQAARALQDQGLQTSARLNAAAQRDADVRGRILELESARLAAVQALANTRRNRALFVSNRHAAWLTGLQEARLQLEDRSLAYTRRLEQRAALNGHSVGPMGLAQMAVPQFEIQSVRPGRAALDVPGDASLMPGDILVVTHALTRADGDP